MVLSLRQALGNRSSTLRPLAARVYTLLLRANKAVWVAIWVWAVFVFRRQPVRLGTALLHTASACTTWSMPTTTLRSTT